MVTSSVITDNDELSRHGYQRLYTTESYEVVPQDFILGKLPLMPDFGTPTIPHKFAGLRNEHFTLGKADSAHDKHDGSSLCYINHFAMTWSRSKVCMNGYSACSEHDQICIAHILFLCYAVLDSVQLLALYEEMFGVGQRLRSRCCRAASQPSSTRTIRLSRAGGTSFLGTVRLCRAGGTFRLRC
jgi:hypothetical protein